MIREITKYETEDGQVHNSRADAARHSKQVVIMCAKVLGSRFSEAVHRNEALTAFTGRAPVADVLAGALLDSNNLTTLRKLLAAYSDSLDNDIQDEGEVRGQ